MLARKSSTATLEPPLQKTAAKASTRKRPWKDQVLPIQSIVPEVMDKLRKKDNLVLQAPTGAGKTTIVPLALLDSGVVEGTILVLQPRRITAIGIARRMAQLYGEALGETIGYRIRHEKVVSNRTKIEVVTDGILLRMLAQNPTLKGIGCIFFDEFHERGIESDVGFALALAAQKEQELKTRLVVMSATLCGLADRVAALLGDPSVITSEGSCFPVEIKYRPIARLDNPFPKGYQPWAEKVTPIIREALEESEGDILVFVPGEREIMYLWIFLNNMGIGDGVVPRNLIEWARRLVRTDTPDTPFKQVEVRALYGHLDKEEQDEVLSPPKEGWRKVIIATPIAESSLTVPRVKSVVDCGLRRDKVEDWTACTSEMVTRPISAASAAQRAGRAGRVSSGTCYRLWDEDWKLQDNDPPELECCELSMVVLNLAMAGHLSNTDILALPWVDKPTIEGLDFGRKLLQRMKMMEPRPGGSWALTARGQRAGKFPVHPRMSHMILQAMAVSDSFARDACDFVALLEEKELLRKGRSNYGADLEARLNALQEPTYDVYRTTRERVLLASAQLQTIADLPEIAAGRPQEAYERGAASVFAAWSYPELVANAEKPGSFALQSGKRVSVDSRDRLCSAKHLAVASCNGDKVFWAVKTTPEVLACHGIDVEDPLNHKLLDVPEDNDANGEEEGDGADEDTSDVLGMVVVQRYLVGKACGAVSSSDDFAEICKEKGDIFKPKEVVSMFWDFARADPVHYDLASPLCEHVFRPRIAEYSVEQLSEVACALASIEIHEEVFDEIAEAVAPQVGQLPCDGEGGNLSGLMWAFTNTGSEHEGLTTSLANRALKEMKEFEPKVLSDVREITFWSFHRNSARAFANNRRGRRLECGFASESFYEALAPMVLESVDDICPITCVYLLWSFSKAGVWNEEIFDSLAKRIGRDVSTLDRCGLTMFAWSYAYSEAENAEVFRLTGEDTLRPERMAEMAPRDVSCVAWAFAKASVHHEGLMDALIEHGHGLLKTGIEQMCHRGTNKSLYRDVYVGDNSAVDAQVDAFDMMSLGDLLWAIREYQISAPEFMATCEEYLIQGLKGDRVDRFLSFPTAFVKVLSTCSSISGDHTELLTVASAQVRRTLRRMNYRQVAALITAWAISGPRDPFLLADFHKRLEFLLSTGKAKALDETDHENLVWAMAELGLDDGPLRAKVAELTA